METSPKRWIDVAVAGILLLAVCAAFGPILGHGFVFDDFALIVGNPGIRGLDVARLRWMFVSTYLTTYMPLGWAAFAAVYSRFGLDPAAFHAANLAAHGLVTIAVYATARRLIRLAGIQESRVPAFAAALLFSVHPFQVNTVAWAIELPDILSTLFFLLAAFVYLGGRGRARLTAVFGLYLVSMLFRWKSVSLPFALIAFDYWPLKRLHFRLGDPFDQKKVSVWAEKAPFIILAVAVASVTALAKSQEGYAPTFAPAAAARALWLYPWALLRPYDYLVAYSLNGAKNSLGMSGAVALILAFLATCIFWLLRRRAPAVLLVWIVYAAAVLPPALHEQTGNVYVYLAYGYLGCVGLFILLGSFVQGRAGLAAISLIALVFVGLTRKESRHWSDSVSFWSRAVERDPSFSPAYGQYGAALLENGRYEAALTALATRLAAEPGDESALVALRTLWNRAPYLRPEIERLTPKKMPWNGRSRSRATGIRSIN